MEFAFCICSCKEELNTHIFRFEPVHAEAYLAVVLISQSGGSVRTYYVNRLEVWPLSLNKRLPACKFTGRLEIIGTESTLAVYERYIVLIYVVCKHAVGGEVQSNLGDGILHVAYPYR